MVIKYIEDIRGNLSILTNFIRSANVQGLLESTLLLKLTEEDEPEVLRLLNSITNQKTEPDRPLTTNFIELVSLMCKEGDILLLDEPDKGLMWYENNYFISFLLAVSSSFKDIYIVTHDEGIFVLNVMGKANFISVKKDKGTVTPYNITKEQANELIDKV